MSIVSRVRAVIISNATKYLIRMSKQNVVTVATMFRSVAFATDDAIRMKARRQMITQNAKINRYQANGVNIRSVS